MDTSKPPCRHPVGGLREAKDYTPPACECSGCGRKFGLDFVIAWELDGATARAKAVIRAQAGLDPTNQTPLAHFVHPMALKEREQRALAAKRTEQASAPKPYTPDPEADERDPGWGHPSNVREARRAA